MATLYVDPLFSLTNLGNGKIIYAKGDLPLQNWLFLLSRLVKGDKRCIVPNESTKLELFF